MKKLSLLFLAVSVFAFCGCSNDDDEVKNEVVISFENQLTKPESEFKSTSDKVSGYYFQDTFKDPANLLTFDHYYSEYPNVGYSFAGFTYINKKNHIYECQPNCGTIKTGNVYIGAYSDENTPASFTINEQDKYAIKGLWITNSKNAYTGMTVGDSYTRAFKKGDWYKVTAIGYDNNNKEIGNISIMLADYKSDTDKPVNDWIWFDLTSLKNATKITITPSCSDSGEFGMNTGKYICIDDITLIEK